MKSLVGIINTILSNINDTEDTYIAIEGYSYSSNAGPLIDLVTFSTLLRDNLLKYVTTNITIVSPGELKKGCAMIVYNKGEDGSYRNNELEANKKGEMLIHKRAANKYHSPNLWTNATCSHPKSGETIIARMGKYGPMVQLGQADEETGKKPKFAKLLRGQHLETVTLEEALVLFILPRELGEFEGKVVKAAIGRFGPYIRHDNKFVSLKEDDFALNFVFFSRLST